jgi:hypothetical protein
MKQFVANAHQVQASQNIGFDGGVEVELVVTN